MKSRFTTKTIIKALRTPVVVIITLFGMTYGALAPAQTVHAQGNTDEVQAAAPIGDAFIYQGRVTDTGGAGINGTCDFIFGLYGAVTGGSAIGSVSGNGVPVADGYFNTSLDFGPTAFDGEQRYLEIQVDCDGAGYVTLSPRQPLAPAPYALYAQDAGSALGLQGRGVAANAPANGDVLKWNGVQWAPAVDNAGSSGGITGIDAGVGLTGGGSSGLIPLDVEYAGSGVADTAARSDHNHDGVYADAGHNHDATYYRESELQTSGQAQVNWDNLTSVPAGVGTSYSAGAGLSLGSGVFSADFGGSGSANQVAHSDHNHDGQYQGAYSRTVVVSPVGSGTDTSANGTALLNALNGITDASATNPYLLKIEPGIYDIGSSSLYMKQYVDIEGSGQTVTTIRGSGSNSAPGATVYTANFTELRQVTVEAHGNGTADYATAIYADTLAGSRIADVQANAKQGRSLIVGIDSEVSTVSLNHVSILVDAMGEGSASIAGLDISSIIGDVENVSIMTVGGNFNRGVLIVDATPTLRNMDIEAYSGNYPRGISVYSTPNYNSNGGAGTGPLIIDSQIYADSIGIYVSKSSPTLRNVNIDAGSTAIDIFQDYTGSVMRIDRSSIVGSSESISGASAYNFEIGATQLDGTISKNSASFVCVNTYNGNYAALGSTC